eukprot:PhM_4_TR12957/c0_g1_i1/m.60130
MPRRTPAKKTELGPKPCSKGCTTEPAVPGCESIDIYAATHVDADGAYRCKKCVKRNGKISKEWTLAFPCSCGRDNIVQQDVEDKNWYCHMCWMEFQGLDAGADGTSGKKKKTKKSKRGAKKSEADADADADAPNVSVSGKRLPKKKDCACGRGDVVDIDAETKTWYCQRCWDEYDGAEKKTKKSKKPRSRGGRGPKDAVVKGEESSSSSDAAAGVEETKE